MSCKRGRDINGMPFECESNLVYNPSDVLIKTSDLQIKYDTISPILLSTYIENNDTNINAIQNSINTLESTDTLLQSQLTSVVDNVSNLSSDVSNLSSDMSLKQDKVSQNDLDMNNFSINNVSSVMSDAINTTSLVVSGNNIATQITYLENELISNDNDIAVIQYKIQNIASATADNTFFDGSITMQNNNIYLLGNKAQSFAVPTEADDYTNKLYVNQQDTILQNQITVNGAGVTSLQNTTTSLQSQITSNDNDILALQNNDVSLQNQITSNDNDITVLQNTDVSLQTQINDLSSGTTADLSLKMNKSSDSDLVMNNFSITGANNIQTTTVNSFNISGSGYVQGAEVRTTGGDIIVTSGDVRPFTTNQSDVGTPSLKFQNGYFNNNVNAGAVLLPTGDVGTKLTDVETKTQNIELTTIAGITEITGVVNVSDKVVTTRVESIGGGGVQPLIIDDFSVSPLKYNSTLIGFGGSQTWMPIHDVGNSWIKLTEDAISTTQGYLVYTQPSILTAIGGATEWYTKVTGFFQDNGNDGNGQCFFTFQHQTPPSNSVVAGIGYTLLYFPALGALYIFYANEPVQFISGQFPVATQNTDYTVEWRIVKSVNNRTFTCYVNGVANPNPYTDTVTRTFDTNFVGVGAYTAGSTQFAADYFIKDVEIDTVPSSGSGGGGSAFIDMNAADIIANGSNINLTTQNVVLGDLPNPLSRTKTVTLIPNNTLGADVGTNDFEFTAGFFNTTECAFIRKRPYANSVTVNDPLTTRELIPDATGTRDIGIAGVRYRNAYFSNNLAVPTADITTLAPTGNTTSTRSLRPIANNTNDLGTVSLRYNNCFVNTLDANYIVKKWVNGYMYLQNFTTPAPTLGTDWIFIRTNTGAMLDKGFNLAQIACFDWEVVSTYYTPRMQFGYNGVFPAQFQTTEPVLTSTYEINLSMSLQSTAAQAYDFLIAVFKNDNTGLVESSLTAGLLVESMHLVSLATNINEPKIFSTNFIIEMANNSWLNIKVNPYNNAGADILVKSIHWTATQI